MTGSAGRFWIILGGLILSLESPLPAAEAGSDPRPAPGGSAPVLNLQISPTSFIFRGYFNLGAQFRVADGVSVGPKGTYRPFSAVHGYEVGLRSSWVLAALDQASDLRFRAGVHYFDLTRDEDKAYHEGGMFTPYYDAHTTAGHYQGLMPEAGLSLFTALADRINFEAGAGIEIYERAFYTTGSGISRVLPVIEMDLGLEF